jgi:hypothetical protein
MSPLALLAVWVVDPAGPLHGSDADELVAAVRGIREALHQWT